jgi:hypothetical protein
MNPKSCLRCILGLPSESEVRDSLSVHFVSDVAGLIGEYENDDVLTLAHKHFISHDGLFLELSSLLAVVIYMYKNGAKVQDVTARGPVLLSYLRRMFGGLPPVEMWPERMGEPAKKILTTLKGFYCAATWCFYKRIDTMEDQYAFCECDNCRHESRPDVVEFLQDASYLVYALEQVVENHCTHIPTTAHRDALMSQFRTPGFSLGYQFELGHALCQE